MQWSNHRRTYQNNDVINNSFHVHILLTLSVFCSELGLKRQRILKSIYCYKEFALQIYELCACKLAISVHTIHRQYYSWLLEFMHYQINILIIEYKRPQSQLINECFTLTRFNFYLLKPSTGIKSYNTTTVLSSVLKRMDAYELRQKIYYY